MRSFRTQMVDLTSAASKAEKTLKSISNAAVKATGLTTGAIFGSLGFTFGAGGVFGGLAAASALVYAPFLVPLGGVCGLLLGALAGRDQIDRANERAIDLVDRVWALRDREAEGLLRQIKIARGTNSPRLPLLEQKLTFLELAPPEQLMGYYGLSDRKPSQEAREHVLLGPAEEDIRAVWRPEQPALEHLRPDGPDPVD